MKKYNPYEDEGLHMVQPDHEPAPLNEREGFNEILKHNDIVNGHQIPKRLDHFPRSMRKVVRIIILLMVISFIGFQIWDLIAMIFQLD